MSARGSGTQGRVDLGRAWVDRSRRGVRDAILARALSRGRRAGGRGCPSGTWARGFVHSRSEWTTLGLGPVAFADGGELLSGGELDDTVAFGIGAQGAH